MNFDAAKEKTNIVGVLTEKIIFDNTEQMKNDVLKLFDERLW